MRDRPDLSFDRELVSLKFSSQLDGNRFVESLRVE